MFTGIIQAIGNIRSKQAHADDYRFVIDYGTLDSADLALGDSIAVNGVCLTVVDFSDTSFSVDVSSETLRCTALAEWKQGDEVNLERAMQLKDRIDGHLVSGHVDAVASILAQQPEGRSIKITIEMPEQLKAFICVKASITVDGTSLTVNQVSDNSFSVNIIPHTLEQTVIKHYTAGTRVNLEVDMLARYLQRMLQCQSS